MNSIKQKYIDMILDEHRLENLDIVDMHYISKGFNRWFFWVDESDFNTFEDISWVKSLGLSDPINSRKLRSLSEGYGTRIGFGYLNEFEQAVLHRYNQDFYSIIESTIGHQRW